MDGSGRLPDFSYAGLDGEAATPPDVGVVHSVVDFGALGDGIHDDTTSIQTAIDATVQGALLFPAGRYRITQPLYIRNSDVVLRGAGREETELFVDASLEDVLGPNQVWSWNGGFIWVRPPQAPQLITTVTQSAPRGARTLTVEDTTGISEGQRIVLALRTLGLAMHVDARRLERVIGNSRSR